MLDPSKPMPAWNRSWSSCDSGMLKCCQVPGTSTNLKSTIFAPCSSARRSTSLGLLGLIFPPLHTLTPMRTTRQVRAQCSFHQSGAAQHGPATEERWRDDAPRRGGRHCPAVWHRHRHGACQFLHLLYLMREQDCLGHLAHRLARIHTELLDAPESFRLFEALAVHENALGAIHDLARLQRLFQSAHLLAQGPELLEAGQRDLDGRLDVGVAERLDEIADDAHLLRALDQLFLAVRGQQQHGRDVLRGQDLRRIEPIELGHLDVHDDDIGTCLARQAHGGRAVAGFADHLISERGEHLPQVEPDQWLIIRYEDAAWGRLGQSYVLLATTRVTLAPIVRSEDLCVKCPVLVERMGDEASHAQETLDGSG